MAYGNSIPVGRIVAAIVAVAVLIFGVVALFQTFTVVHADEIVVKQDAVDGDLQFWTTPGMHNQSFGKLTRYKKSTEYSFSAAKDQGQPIDQSIRVRFNDGGHGQISGTLRFELPLDSEHLTMLHTKFASQDAIEHQLIRPVVERAVYMSGPLMSSKESSAERRSDLIQFIEDQVTHGVYKTTTEEVKVKDPISGQERTVTMVKLVKDEKGNIARQEASPLEDFGVKTYSFSINGITYDDEVEKQIKGQQALAMQVQTAIANAKRAEQDAITAAKEGEAEAMKAKWAQEVIKTTAVTAAEKEVAVAELQVKKAQLFKQEQTLLGEGEAARRSAVLAADGALEQKLDAYVAVQKAWAEQAGKQRLVPEVIMGGGSGEHGGGNAAMDMMSLVSAKAARDLALDVGIGSGRKAQPKQVASDDDPPKPAAPAAKVAAAAK